MTWIRRNWVDLFLVVLILGVVLGFTTLLLRGSPLGELLGRVGAAANPSRAQPAGIPEAAPAEPVLDPEPAEQLEPPLEAVPAAELGATDGTPPVDATDEAPPVDATEDTLPVDATEDNPPVIDAEPAGTSGAGINPGPAAGRQKAPASQAQPIVEPPAAPARPPTRAEYRIGIAAYTDAERAGRVAERVTGAGYPAFAVGSRDDLTVVLAGPFAGQAAAAAALTALRRTYPGAILYPPQADAPAAASPGAAPAQPAPASAAPAAGNPTAAAPASTAAAPVYLQVGAFRDPQAATALIERLREAGYTVRLRSGADGLSRAVVGPLGDPAAERALADLKSRGLSAFKVR